MTFKTLEGKVVSFTKTQRELFENTLISRKGNWLQCPCQYARLNFNFIINLSLGNGIFDTKDSIALKAGKDWVIGFE
ncbi:MAG: hypothetical protein DRR19_16005 [Candidatus Parabeggiatoa sp. nov. 1]|nr:MAG: hypothetical protein DRR19_16005 [Gammaproteobacteria bacterium]